MEAHRTEESQPRDRIRVWLVVLSLVGILVPSANLHSQSSRLVRLYSWWSGDNTDHLCTSDPKWAGSGGSKKDGYGFYRTDGYIYSPDAPQPADTVPLYRWWSPSRKDYFTTSNPNWAGSPGKGQSGYQFVRLEGYLLKSPGSGRLPLKSYWSVSRSDNVATTDSAWDNEQRRRPDYRQYRIEGYVLTQSQLPGALTMGAIQGRIAGKDTSSVFRSQAQSEERLETQTQVALPVSTYVQMVLATPADAKQETEEENERLGAKGPGGIPIYLAQTTPALVRDLDKFGFDDIGDILNLSPIVYRDTEPTSGVFYFHPKRYAIKWTPEDRYYLDFIHGADTGSGKNVAITATLTSGAQQRDRDILRNVLAAYLRAEGEPTTEIKLRPLAVIPEPEISWQPFVSEAPQMGAMSLEDGLIVLSASAGVQEKQQLVEAIIDRTTPVGGRVFYRLSEISDSLPDYPATASFKLTDSDAYGRSPWVRTEGESHSEFRNDHAFTVRLDHLLYLYDTGSRLELRGYDLGARTLAPGGIARVPNERVHSQVDGAETLDAWYAYVFQPTDAEMDSVFETLRGGVGSLDERSVRIRVGDLAGFQENHGLELLTVIVRSRFFDPDPSVTEQEDRYYEFEPGGASEENVATLFAPADTAEPLYRYRIVLYTDAGELYTDFLEPSVTNAELIFVRGGQIRDLLAE